MQKNWTVHLFCVWPYEQALELSSVNILHSQLVDLYYHFEQRSFSYALVSVYSSVSMGYSNIMNTIFVPLMEN